MGQVYLAASGDDVWIARHRGRLRTLWLSQGDEALQIAAEALRDEVPDIRVSGIYFLGRRYLKDDHLNSLDPRIVDLLIERLWDTDGQVVYEAIWHAASTKAPKALASLVVLSTRKPVWLEHIRAAISQHTGKPLEEFVVNYPLNDAGVGDIDAPIRRSEIEYQASLLKQGSQAERVSAALRLTWVDTPQAVEMLISAVHDENPRVRFAAVQSLNALRSHSRRTDPVIQVLLSATSDDNIFVRRMAISSLATHDQGPRGPEIFKFLKERLLNDKDPFSRLAAVRGLPFVGSDGRMTSDILLNALTDEFYEVREAAVFGIKWACVPDAVQSATQVLNDSNVAVRRAAAFKMAVGPQGVLHSLMRALDDPDQTVRRFAAQSLQNFDTIEVRKRLRETAESDASDDIRRSARQSIQQLELQAGAKDNEEHQRFEKMHKEQLAKDCER